MTKTSLAAVLVLAMIGTAQAGGQAGSIGVGAEYGLAFGSPVPSGVMGGTIGGIGLASMNYDAGDFHAGAFLGFQDGGNDNDTDYALGGRFFYHMHSVSMADFGVGGNLGFVSVDTGRDRATLMFLEPGIQIRLFPASNVALSFTAGLAIGLVDAKGFGIGAQPTGAAGVHYYFF